MTIELTILISVLSFSFAVYTGVSNMKRNQRAETKSETTSMTTVIVKLENISASIGELKTSTKSFQEEIKDLGNDLKIILKSEEDFQRSYLMAQQELAAAREGYKRMEERMRNPLVFIILKICTFFEKRDKQSL